MWRRRNGLLVLLALLPVLYYVLTVGWYAWNMPYLDDYPVLVRFLNRWPEASASGRLALLLEQNNFHRVVWVKVLALLNVSVTGTLNFTFLQLAGNAALLLTAFLLGRAAPATHRWLLLPALFLLFQFQSWNNAFWAMAAVSNLWAPAWVLLSLRLASRTEPKQPILALLAGLAALLTNGNGIAALPLLVLLQVFSQRRPLRAVLPALLITVVALGLYFRGYSNPSGIGLSRLLTPDRLWHLLELDTAFLGALFYHPSVAWLSQLAGLFTLGWTAYLLLTRYDRTDPTLFWFLVFLQLTGLMLALNRIEKGTELMYASRYRNITALVFATTYLTLADVIRLGRPRWLKPFGLAAGLGAVVVWGISNYTYASKVSRFRELKQTDQFLWQQFGQIRASAPQYEPVRELTQLTQSRRFRPTPLPVQALVSQPVILTISPAGAANGPAVTHQLDIREAVGRFYVVSGWAKLQGRPANFNDTYLGVRRPGGWQFYRTLFHQRLDNDDAINNKDTGFTAILPLADRALLMGLFVRSGGASGFVLLP